MGLRSLRVIWPTLRQLVNSSSNSQLSRLTNTNKHSHSQKERKKRAIQYLSRIQWYPIVSTDIPFQPNSSESTGNWVINTSHYHHHYLLLHNSSNCCSDVINIFQGLRSKCVRIVVFFGGFFRSNDFSFNGHRGLGRWWESEFGKALTLRTAVYRLDGQGNGRKWPSCWRLLSTTATRDCWHRKMFHAPLSTAIFQSKPRINELNNSAVHWHRYQCAGNLTVIST